MITRRLATPADAAAVHAISSAPAVVPFLTYDPMPFQAFEPIFARLLATEAFYVWEVEGRVAGTYRIARYEGRQRHVALLGWVAVDPGLQGRGVGLAMLSEALELLRTEGVSRVELLAEADNVRGLAFYRKLGFQIEGVQRAAYRRAGEAGLVDEVMMALLLDAQSSA